LLPRIAAGADWAGFRGPGGQGHSDAKGLPTTWSAEKNVLWKTALPGPGGSSPILVGKRIFLTCYTGYALPGRPRGNIEQLKRHLVCLDRSTGKVAWTRDVPPALPESARNREDHGYSTSTPVADAERVYVFYGKTGVFAYNLDGRKLWHADVGSRTSGWGSAASPVLCGDLLIVNASVESECLVALDKRTGREKWRAGGIKESWNTPILVPAGQGRTELVVAIHGKVLGFDPATGKQLWSCRTDIPWYMVPSLVTDGRVVYCIGGRGTGGALAVRPGGRGDVTTTHRLWKVRKGSNVPSPIYHDGYLYWAHEKGTACCAEAKTGRLVYEEPLPRAGQVYASPILADGKLYYVSRWGRCYVVAAKPEFSLLSTNELGRVGTINASPAAETGRLYIRSNQFLFCLGTRK
jgi:outer membrane protein assembly factor BamB